MKRLLIFLVLPGLLLATTSCFSTDESLQTYPGSCTTVMGRLVTNNGQIGVQGATVQIVWRKFLGSVAVTTKAKATTDTNGNYRATFFIKDAELNSGFYNVAFTVDTNKYLASDDEKLYLLKVERDTTIQAADYLIPRKAFVNLTLTNQSKLSDLVDVQFASAHGEPLLPSASRLIMTVGYTSDKLPGINPFAVAADQPLFFTLFNSRNGAIVRNTDTLHIAAGTTRTISVSY
ncbi:hypothetical protein GKZ68_05970 [Hymenobacter sp. BRD128]|uniref:hypothetical protein n=1 Tax=Hymenobacter sp. BRD128 TaxID=2675878 RepID=UPI001565302C|nr:hypothetical protein [Hymenobacter sp. BRD128]QKG56230.1 hypothetical protein GKZ68_05970 [Hymenobacter sp. BRD128]